MTFDEATIADAIAGNRRAMARLTDDAHRAWVGGDRSGVEGVLDRLAAAASSAPAAVEIVVSLTDRLDLAKGAIRQVLVSDEDVADAVQRTLLSVNRGLPRFQSGARYRTWLFTVAKNEALQVLRARRRVPEPVDEVGEHTEPFVQRMSSVVASRELIHRVIRELPEPFRTAVVLRDLEQLEYREIAQQLGVELGTVKSRIRRGRDLAAEQLQELARRRP